MNFPIDGCILAIETSCDETAAAVVRGGRHVLSDVVATQVDIHALYGGVVPEIASRQHVQAISAVVAKAVGDSGLTPDQIDAVAVTYGPGLVGALLVGVSFAKAYAWALHKPLIAVNHIEAHIAANYVGTMLEPPFLCLVVSGGHTELLHVRDYHDVRYLGGTLDDAAGEAFDKTARVLGLGYPGGSKIDALAKEGDPDAYAFPRAMMKDEGYDFSFSGMKTAVLQHGQRHGAPNAADMAASIQRAIVDVLVEKSMRAAHATGAQTLVMAGGVSANSGLRAAMAAACARAGIGLYVPPLRLCTDNAVMVGAAAWFCARDGQFADLTLNADPGLELSLEAVSKD